MPARDQMISDIEREMHGLGMEQQDLTALHHALSNMADEDLAEHYKKVLPDPT